ncbi:MAG: hypothetical protein LBK42_11235 [Propionibacteriaceae bacterium]|jgi:hypothetical protein|nr:hypothetical protein [Propionibacteriaceae bacterium]
MAANGVNNWSDTGLAAQALSHPGLPPADLMAIAQARPELRTTVALHPNAYPSLLDWLAAYGDEATRRAVSLRRAPGAPAPDVFPGSPAPGALPGAFAPGAPAAPPRAPTPNAFPGITASDPLAVFPGATAPGAFAPGTPATFPRASAPGTPASIPPAAPTVRRLADPMTDTMPSPAVPLAPLPRPVPASRSRNVWLVPVLVGAVVVLIGAAALTVRWLLGHDDPSPAPPAAPVTVTVQPDPSPPVVTVTVTAEPSAPAGHAVVADRAAASSTHEGEDDEVTGKHYEYGADNTLDGSRETAWFENAEDDGLGQWIDYSFDSTVTLRGLWIENGYWRSQTRLAENNRIKCLELAFGDGSVESFCLDDPVVTGFQSSDGVDGQQLIFQSDHRCRSVRLTIVSVYSGSRWQDTGITDVVFWADR